MSDQRSYNEQNSDDDQNIQGAPNSGSTDADTASGGSPDSGANPDKVDPDTGTDEDDQPVENPSGG
ncbi:hypothetical protein GCM10022288_14650 [Gryllotalpicola kribbensis]|jgi:hypothetical protein|uniref:Uncharacterized protein n=1 Tax=Gryllotalpicola kribbensis TaxID=993084 RepID=A0ABP8AQW9_9MICO